MSIPGPHDITRREMSNGIVVLVREHHTSPAVVINGYLEAGARDETDAQAGLAAFTAATLSRGTTTRTFDELYEAVESVGAGFGVSAGMHATGFGAKSLAEDLPLILDVLADVLRRPTFPPAEVEKVRGEILTDLEERANDTRRMAILTSDCLAYPTGHPYARAVSGYIPTVSALTHADLLDFYRRGFGPQGMVVTVVGAVDTQRALDLIEVAFGDWDGPTQPRPPLPPVAAPDGVQSEVLNIPGKTQTDIILGYPGPARADPDFIDAVLCNTVLGVFGMMGRLGDSIRDEQGLAYYCYSRVGGGPGPGPWTAVAGVDPANVERAIDSIRAEIRRITIEPVPPDELADSKTFVIGSLPLRLETNEGVARATLDMERYALGLDYLQRYEEMIRQITSERVLAVAQKWLDPDAYALAIAGKENDE